MGRRCMPADFEGMDERTLLAEVERRVRQCHAELRRHATFRQRRTCVSGRGMGRDVPLSGRVREPSKL